jgi:hypothetical protein
MDATAAIHPFASETRGCKLESYTLLSLKQPTVLVHTKIRPARASGLVESDFKVEPKVTLLEFLPPSSTRRCICPNIRIEAEEPYQ